MVSAMAGMSRAIRETVERYSPTIQDLPDDVLKDFDEIVWAFALDLTGERKRRAARDEAGNVPACTCSVQMNAGRTQTLIDRSKCPVHASVPA